MRWDRKAPWRKRLRKLGRIRPTVRRWLARVHPDPIFVLGTQKTGTTAIANLLAAATGESLTADIFYRIDEPVERRLLAGEMALAGFVHRHRLYFSTRIIKEPSLTFLYEPLRARFPDARYVFVYRDPRDTVRSVLNRLGMPGDLDAPEPEPLASLDADRSWGLILSGYGLEPAEHYIDRLAIRWRAAARLLLAQPEAFTPVCYERFVKDKVGEIQALAQQLSLEVRHDIRDKVDIAYQPPGDRNVSWESFFGQSNLQRIESLCAEEMRKLGYAPSMGPGDARARADAAGPADSSDAADPSAGTEHRGRGPGGDGA